MGSMYLGFGLSVAALTFAVPKLASESSRRYAAYACIFSAAMLFRQIVSLYTWKTGKLLAHHSPLLVCLSRFFRNFISQTEVAS